MTDIEKLKQIVEGALLAAGDPLSLNQLAGLFPDDEQPGHGALREALAALDADCETRAVELREVANGYRLQVRENMMPWIGRLWAEKPAKYTRAMLETLAIIAYRQPITRGEIEQIRGVAVSSNILRTLQERDWIKSLGHRDVPGRPELLGTTKTFLDYFNLKSLDELPTLAEIKDLDNLEPELELPDPNAARPHAGEDQDESAQTEKDTAEAATGQPEEAEQPEPGPDDGHVVAGDETVIAQEDIGDEEETHASADDEDDNASGHDDGEQSEAEAEEAPETEEPETGDEQDDRWQRTGSTD